MARHFLKSNLTHIPPNILCTWHTKLEIVALLEPSAIGSNDLTPISDQINTIFLFKKRVSNFLYDCNLQLNCFVESYNLN